MSRRKLPLWAVAGCLCGTSTALAQGTGDCLAQSIGPDVCVGDMPDIVNYGAVGGIAAFSFGTTSCNVGNANVRWIAGTREHPVIGQNMYRVKNGRFEQIGQSFLKHGFTALTGNVCCTCSGVGGSQLGVGCSDPYTASRNGSQTNCGPKYPVNANTGFFPYPYTTSVPTLGYTAPPAAPATIGRRLQVATADLDPVQNPGAIYLMDTHYVTRDDAFAGNGLNNLSYRRINVTSSTTVAFTAPATTTTRRTAAIEGWKTHPVFGDPTVALVKVDYNETNAVPVPVAGEPTPQVHTARFIVAAKVTDLGGGNFQYSYSIMNVNSDRSAIAFAIPYACSTTISQLYFHSVLYHSGEPFSNAAWSTTTTGGNVTWNGPKIYSEDPYTNALRWGTTYTYSFVANAPSATGSGTLTFFKPGQGGGDPLTLTVNNIPVPSAPCRADQDGSAGITPADIAAFVNKWFDSLTNGNLLGDFDCDGFVAPADIAGYVNVWINALNGIGC